MDAAQVNITLGTAGHIDHGKTALIKCLTGCDTDTLKEEKERGMSIDLGFAPCTISGTEIGIVDVPGHENFIKTMVAGATGIDGVIFVVAADDGIMPQTREHLDILTLLGVSDGIVALTKADIVATEHLEKVAAELNAFLSGTFLEGAPVVPVSSVTGQGLEQFYETLKELVGRLKPKNMEGVFRMPVDRAFSLKGYGTVVTGIPAAGRIQSGDEAVIFPQAAKGRIKAIQVYKRNSDAAMCGQCAALNVSQWDHKTIKRGNVVTVGEYFSPEYWYLCQLRVLGRAGFILKNAANVKFHTGTSEVAATVYLMEGNQTGAGSECLAQFKLSEPVVAAPRDRFIIRTASPAQTIGGGMIIEATTHKLKRTHPDVLADIRDRAKAVLKDKGFVEYCIKTADSFAARKEQISLRAKLPPEPLWQIFSTLANERKIVDLGGNLHIHTDTLAELSEQLASIVGRFHRASPESPGIAAEQLHRESGLEKDLFDGLVRLLMTQGTLVERKHRIALPSHKETFKEDEQRLLGNTEALFERRLFNPPNVEEVVTATEAAPEQVRKILRMLLEQERLVRVEGDLLFHRQAIDKARQTLVSYIQKEGKLESVKFKYLLDTTRKFAIPLLDYFDKIGVTRRLGNTRYLKGPAESTND